MIYPKKGAPSIFSKTTRSTYVYIALDALHIKFVVNYTAISLVCSLICFDIL